MVRMVDTTPLDEAQILGTAVTASGLAAEAPVRIPVQRYTSAGFAELEHLRLWPSVWHVACTEDHVSEPGDWFEHRLGRYSVLLVRGDDGALRGFQNVCRHRGNAICQGSGSGASELRCPYHRWAWDLAGRLREVPSRRGFGPLRNDELGLVPVRGGHLGPPGVREPGPRRRSRWTGGWRASPKTSPGPACTSSAATTPPSRRSTATGRS